MNELINELIFSDTGSPKYSIYFRHQKMPNENFAEQATLDCVAKTFCVAQAVAWYWDVLDIDPQSSLSNLTYIAQFRSLYNAGQDYSNIPGVSSLFPSLSSLLLFPSFPSILSRVKLIVLGTAI